MKNKFTILGCGSSLGSPWITNYSAKLKKSTKNTRTRCCAHIQKGDLSILIDTSPDIKSQFLKNKIKNLENSNPLSIKNARINFNNLKKIEKKNYSSFKGNFSIKENNIEEELEPELRIYNQPNIVTSEADIRTTLLKDKFITMNTVQNEEYFNIRYQVKPFMQWIWLSVLFISSGALISLFKKEYEK